MRRKDREITEPSAIMQILQKADVCRIAMCEDNVPYVVTMNFGFGKPPEAGFAPLYFHTAPEGKKIDILRKNNLVCFEADIEHEFFLHTIACGCSMKYQSVVGTGRMSFVEDRSEKLDALQALMTHYTEKSGHVFKEEMLARTTVMRLDIEEITAKAHPGYPREFHIKG